jgi:telomerase protein component 1
MAGWRNVRIFLSSTFRDMHAERDHLIKVTFFALRERLLPHRVELYDIDLRWGITEDEARNEKVIRLCLEQVDECRPFFLAFLGHRYGWVPGRIPADTIAIYPFVAQFPGVSVSELELRHGAMIDPRGKRSLVLLRGEGALASIPDATRNLDFLDAEPALQAKLRALRAELEACPVPVQPYSAFWNRTLYDRVNRTRGKFDGLDDFGKQVSRIGGSD